MKSTDVSDDSPLGVEGLLSVVGQDFEPSQQAVERAQAGSRSLRRDRRRLSFTKSSNARLVLRHQDAK